MLIKDAVQRQCCNVERNCLAGGCMAWRNEPKYTHIDVVVDVFDTKTGNTKRVEKQRVQIDSDSGYCALVEGERHE